MASKALERNLTVLGPLVLPWTENLKFVANWVARRLASTGRRPPAYVPNFSKAFDHFCLHAGAHCLSYRHISTCGACRFAWGSHMLDLTCTQARCSCHSSPIAPSSRVQSRSMNCLSPAGGRGVIDGLGKQLALPDRQLEPSYASLYWYGNTSSASTWYGLSFIETVQRVRAGERIWQARPADMPCFS